MGMNHDDDQNRAEQAERIAREAEEKEARKSGVSLPEWQRHKRNEFRLRLEEHEIERQRQIKEITAEVLAELARALKKFPREQASAHEGYAVLLEEVDELWDEVKGNHVDRGDRLRKEAIQVAAMAIRFVLESA